MGNSEARAILDVSLEVRLGTLQLKTAFELRSDWTILFGPSGAGKSTLLRLLAGLTRPDAGKVIMGGRVLIDSKARVFVAAGKRSMGLVMQEPWLFPHMSVRQNVEFSLGNLGSSAKADRVAEVLELCHAADLIDRMPSQLSGGERQRVALARAMAARPRVLLLDEPFAAMDGTLRASIIAKLVPWLTSQGMSAIYVSHDLADAYQVGADALLMRDGRILDHGPVESVLSEERNRLLRQLGARSGDL